MVHARRGAAVLLQGLVAFCWAGWRRHPQIAVRDHIAVLSAAKVRPWVIGAQWCLVVVGVHARSTACRVCVS